MQHFDVIVVGAGLSGICMAHYLKTACPNKTFAILESRNRLGGTWDLFRYPGIRSDSDMGTLGYRFREWTAAKQIADGPAIRSYIEATAEEDQTKKHILYKHKVTVIEWNSVNNIWTVTAETGEGKSTQFTCGFYINCTGYYKYDTAHTPNYKNKDAFTGQFIHPQFWPEDLDIKGKKIVVIGSGATAVTLVPALVQQGAGKVTMLQRSPSYYVAVPKVDIVAKVLQKIIPKQIAYKTVRWKNFMFGHLFFQFSQRFPKATKKLLIRQSKKQLSNLPNFEKHFTPSYFPWDQRLCLVPDGDFFDALKKDNCHIFTEHIDAFETNGIRLKNGDLLEADIIVSATGLSLQVLGGTKLVVDNKPIDVSKCYVYKSVMLSDVPNFAVILGYTNASWTLKADLAAEYISKHLNYMETNGYKKSITSYTDQPVRIPIMSDLKSGYIERVSATLPSTGEKAPWKADQNYLKDIKVLRKGKVKNNDLIFS